LIIKRTTRKRISVFVCAYKMEEEEEEAKECRRPNLKVGSARPLCVFRSFTSQEKRSSSSSSSIFNREEKWIFCPLGLHFFFPSSSYSPPTFL